MITHVEDIMPIKLRSQARQTPCRKNSRTMKTAMAVSCWGGQFWEGDGESILEDKWTEYHWAVSWKWLRWKILCYVCFTTKKNNFLFYKTGGTAWAPFLCDGVSIVLQSQRQHGVRAAHLYISLPVPFLPFCWLQPARPASESAHTL